MIEVRRRSRWISREQRRAASRPCARRGRRSARRPAGQRGDITSARAMATRCCSPPDSIPGRCARRSPSPTRRSSASAADAALRDGHPRDARGHLGVLERRELGQQVVELEHEPDRAVAERHPLGVAQRRHVGRRQSRPAPASAASSPPSTCSSVLFPTPDAPTTATISPCSTSRSSAFRTGCSRVRRDTTSRGRRRRGRAWSFAVAYGVRLRPDCLESIGSAASIRARATYGGQASCGGASEGPRLKAVG